MKAILKFFKEIGTSKAKRRLKNLHEFASKEFDPHNSLELFEMVKTATTIYIKSDLTNIDPGRPYTIDFISGYRSIYHMRKYTTGLTMARSNGDLLSTERIQFDTYHNLYSWLVIADKKIPLWEAYDILSNDFKKIIELRPDVDTSYFDRRHSALFYGYVLFVQAIGTLIDD